MVSGTSELLDGMQDPRVRRNALHGLKYAIHEQEEKQGPLAPVAPVVRAVIAFSEPLEDEVPSAEAQPSKRIHVRAAVRQRQEAPPAAPRTPVEEPPPQAEAALREVPRRPIAIRKVEPPVVAPSAEPNVEAPRTSVRRIVINRDS
jgi:hypothetical protein